MGKRIACPYCRSDKHVLSGKLGKIQRYKCLGCGKRFLAKYQKGHHGRHLVLRLVNTYFHTRGSYRRTSDSVDHKVSYVTVYRTVDLLGAGCKDPVKISIELRPVWSGILGCGGKVIKVHGEERIFLSSIDVGTQDLVDWKLSRHEDYLGIRTLLKEVRDVIGYEPKTVVIDLDPLWKEAVQRIFPDVPIQLCVVHFERIVDRIIPKRKRTPIQEELKGMVR